jgi:hypothetical protein
MSRTCQGPAAKPEPVATARSSLILSAGSGTGKRPRVTWGVNLRASGVRPACRAPVSRGPAGASILAIAGATPTQAPAAGRRRTGQSPATQGKRRTLQRPQRTRARPQAPVPGNHPERPASGAGPRDQPCAAGEAGIVAPATRPAQRAGRSMPRKARIIGKPGQTGKRGHW